MAAIIRASYAFSFNFLNKDGDSVIGIFDDKKGQTSTLQIINTSRSDLRLKTLNAANASATNHHFELKFRPGTLNTTAPITIDAGAGAEKGARSGQHRGRQARGCGSPECRPLG